MDRESSNMDYEEKVVSESAPVVDVDFSDLEAFMKSLMAPPTKQLSPKEKVDVRRRVEDILFDKRYSEVYGDPFGDI